MEDDLYPAAAAVSAWLPEWEKVSNGPETLT